MTPSIIYIYKEGGSSRGPTSGESKSALHACPWREWQYEVHDVYGPTYEANRYMQKDAKGFNSVTYSASLYNCLIFWSGLKENFLNFDWLRGKRSNQNVELRGRRTLFCLSSSPRIIRVSSDITIHTASNQRSNPQRNEMMHRPYDR